MGTFVVLAVLIAVVALIVRGIVRVENLPAAVTVHIAEAAINKENKDSDRSCL